MTRLRLVKELNDIFDDGLSRIFSFDSGAKVRVKYNDGFLRATLYGDQRYISECDTAEQLADDILDSDLIK
jgi:hypothetical protein